MQVKKLNNCFLLFLVILLLTGFFTLPVIAQDKPIAFKKKTELSANNKKEYNDAAQKYKDDPSVENRNRLIFMAVSQIDLIFNEYQRTRRIGNNLFQILLDILEIGASTAISIVNGERAKSIIGEGLTLLQGSRATINKNLRLLELQVLFNKMIEKRSEIMITILKNAGKSNEEYAFDRAYLDIVNYYLAGTMDSALSSLATDTGASAQAQQDLLTDQRRAGIKFAPTQAEINIANLNLTKIRAIIGAYAQQEDIITAENAKADSNAAVIATAKDKQEKILEKLRVLYGLIEGNSKIAPLLSEIPAKYGKDNAAFKLRLENSLRVLKEDISKATIGDFDLILPKLGGVVVDKISDDPSLGTEFQKILDSYKP